MYQKPYMHRIALIPLSRKLIGPIALYPFGNVYIRLLGLGLGLASKGFELEIRDWA